ncbi:MAG: hypothetical protein KIS67_05380 [Verrucomicrobiae bacterium]|nr:hypothetical protein [Verrucomicrobiae bacterium]
MKAPPTFLLLCFLGSQLLGQISKEALPSSQKLPGLNPDSQANITIIVNELFSGRPPAYPPLAYTNVLSNTNLFAPVEQELLAEIPLKYKNVTTNTGPLGTVLVALTNSAKGWAATFQYTNADAREEITFAGMKIAKFRTKAEDGYDVDLSRRDEFTLNFRQIKGGAVHGLFVSFYEGRCASWMRFENGKAVGKWLLWGEGTGGPHSLDHGTQNLS